MKANMKRIVMDLVIIVMLCPMTVVAQNKRNEAIAQREIHPINWKVIRKQVEQDSLMVKRLVERMSADKIDTTLTFDERRLAFYGQSFLTEDREEHYMHKLDSLEREKDYESCLGVAETILEINPLSLDALMSLARIIRVMVKDSTRYHDITLNDGQVYYNRAMRIFNTIATTGDGSDDHPFFVTKISDEYNFMRYYLDLWDYSMQEATACCDVIKLDGFSKYYKLPTISFEITRIYELERLRFQK